MSAGLQASAPMHQRCTEYVSLVSAVSVVTDGCFGGDGDGDTGGSSTCGNGVAEQGETCDGQDLAGTSCTSLGFDGGVLACTADCSSFDVSGCTTGGSDTAICGNGIIETDEQCDGSNLGGSSCTSLGYSGGTLSCNGSCRFDTSACTEDTGCGCPASFIGDGFCDEECNNAECSFDAGDCDEPEDCAPGCLSTMLGDGACDDACDVAACTNDYGDCASSETCSDLCLGWSADGYCDLSCNMELCLWDGGDCCQSTCTDATYSCGGSSGTNFSCEDSCSGLCGSTSPANGLSCSCHSDCVAADNCCPDYETLCVEVDPGTDPGSETCTGNQSYLADGWCDTSTNSQVCGWDGGDCCESTCVDATYICGYFASFNCLDPAACENTGDCCNGPPSYIGDGYCDSSTNSAACGWDGGDCCESTCVDSTFSCGIVAYICQDPSACENSASGCP